MGINSVHRRLALLISVSVLFLSEVGLKLVPARAMPRGNLAQQLESGSDANRAAAERAFTEGEQLFQRGTVESRRQAIEKFEAAVRLYRVIGDKGKEASSLHGIGLVYYALGEKQKTLDYYNQALSLWRTLNNRSAEAGILWAIAGVHSDLGDKQKSLDTYNQALSLFRAVGDRNFEAFTLTTIGSVYVSLGEKQKALEAFNQALTIQRELRNRSQEAETLSAIGMLYLASGETPQALESLNQALSLFRATGDRAQEAQTLNTLGLLYYALGENQKALDSYNQALIGFRALQDRSSEALLLQGLGGVYNSMGEKQKALDSFNQALVLVREAGNRTAEAEILTNVGILYIQLGENRQALSAYNQSLQLFRSLGARDREAFTLNGISEIHTSNGEYQKALDTYNQALELQRQVSDRIGQANTLNYIALVYRALGDYPGSLNAYNQALSLFRETGNIDGEAQTLDNIGGIYRLLEDYPQALAFTNQALAIWQQQRNRPRQAAVLSTLVRIYESMGDYPQALNAANQILSLGRELGDRFTQGSGLVFLGRVYRASGDYQKAVEASTEGLSLLRTAGFRQAEPPTLDNIGKAYDGWGQPQKALEAYNQALLLWRTLGDRAGEAETLYNMARVERKRGNLNAAFTQIESTINIIEALRTNVVSQDLRTSYFASVQKYYQFYIDLLMQLHRQNPTKGYDALALHASERARARSLLELLNEANADIRQGVDPQLVERERSLQQQINANAERLQQLLSSKNTETQAVELQKRVDDLLKQYQEVQTQIRTKSPRYAALTQPQPLKLSEIQQQVLDDDTVLLEYSLGEERSYLWAVTKTSITSYELPKRADIEAAAKQFRQVLTDKIISQDTSEVAKTSAQLSQLILSPVAQKLGNKRLLIVGDGILQYIPFAALSAPATEAPSPIAHSNYEPLIVKHEIVYSPSASAIAISRRELQGRTPAPKTIALLADPVFNTNDERLNQTAPQANRRDASRSTLESSASEAGINLSRLPFTRQEAEAIIALVPANEREQAFDFNASLDAATSPELSQYRIVHFATHGILNPAHPELSGLVLSLVNKNGSPQQGFLRLNDIFNLKLSADLVVLSACKTATGQVIRGEGIVGLTRGFMYAGAARIVASLWSVNDPATAELMAKFYQQYLQEGLSSAASLRAAQIEMWKQKQWQAPYYWAAFTLQGEWRRTHIVSGYLPLI